MDSKDRFKCYDEWDRDSGSFHLDLERNMVDLVKRSYKLHHKRGHL